MPFCFTIIGKAGFASVTQKVDVAVIGQDEGTTAAPEAVVGAAFNANKHISLNVNIDKVFTDGMNKTDYLNPDKFATITTYNVGMTYKF